MGGALDEDATVTVLPRRYAGGNIPLLARD